MISILAEVFPIFVLLIFPAVVIFYSFTFGFLLPLGEHLRIRKLTRLNNGILSVFKTRGFPSQFMREEFSRGIINAVKNRAMSFFKYQLIASAILFIFVVLFPDAYIPHETIDNSRLVSFIRPAIIFQLSILYLRDFFFLACGPARQLHQVMKDK